jgi:ATP-binding cassette subfamily C (CFTR/MRP) protein 1
MIFFIPINALVGRYLKQLQEKRACPRTAHTGARADTGRPVMKNRDARSRMMSELLANIRSIKLHAWELAFMRRILAVRNDKELVMLRKYGLATVRSSVPLRG